MENNDRRAAADARRLIRKGAGYIDRDATKSIREVLLRHFHKGREVGRKEREAELPNANVRASLLAASVGLLRLMETQTAAIPNSDAAVGGYREAIAILTDVLGTEEKLPRTKGRASIPQSDVDAVLEAQESAKAKKAKPKRKTTAKAKAKPKAKKKVKADG